MTQSNYEKFFSSVKKAVTAPLSAMDKADSATEAQNRERHKTIHKRRDPTPSEISAGKLND